jgi:hypothetical protein
MATTSTTRVLASGGPYMVTEVTITWDNADKDWSASHGGPKGVEPLMESITFSTDPTDGFATNHEINYDTTNGEIDVVITSQPQNGGSAAGSVAGAVSRIKMLWNVVANQDGDSLDVAHTSG